MATLLYAGGTAMAAVQPAVILEAPSVVPLFEVAEFVVRVKEPPFQNPFTDAELAGVFTDGKASLRVAGFADSPDGSVFRLRFSPVTAGTSYRYELTLKGGAIDRRFTGTLRCQPSSGDGPVVVDPARPKHFIYAGSRRPFYHLGYTAYHLLDPFHRLASAHAYADFFYGDSAWADFIITQQYGNEKQVHDWALKHRAIPMPYVNEEYGYEGGADKPGHGQNSDWTRRCHWAMAMAGGYATYGDWSGGVSYFYMGEPGPGKTAVQLKHLRSFFEATPFRDLAPHDHLTSCGFCLAQPPAHYVFYFPRGGTSEIDLGDAPVQRLAARWFDPRTGQWQDGPGLHSGKNTVSAPTEDDWALLLAGKEK